MDDVETIDLEADIVSLLEAERSPEPAPVEAKERVWERIQETLAVPPAATAASEATGLTGGGAATVIGVLVAGVVIAVAMPETPSQSQLNTPHPETSVHQLMEPAVAVPASPPPMVAPVVVALEQAPREPDAAVGQIPPPEPAPEARPAGTSRRASAPKGLSAAERALLDQGRSALREGRPGAALRAADEHQKRFPRGRLIEERAALRIRALDRLGRRDASREAARVFLRRYPTSIHGIAIERILGSD